jgi:hypothetical protein
MLVTERMRSLGEHAKSSRQPPLKERKQAKADGKPAKQDAVDETLLEKGGAHESTAAAFVDDLAPEIFAEPQPAATADNATQAKALQEDDDTSAAKRAIIHEWENWSALHSDELNDPNVAEYFFRHLQGKRAYLIDFCSSAELTKIQEWCRKKFEFGNIPR